MALAAAAPLFTVADARISLAGARNPSCCSCSSSSPPLQAPANPRRRRKPPRPSFQEQALSRWSARRLRSSSPQTLLPWQEEEARKRKLPFTFPKSESDVAEANQRLETIISKLDGESTGEGSGSVAGSGKSGDDDRPSRQSSARASSSGQASLIRANVIEKASQAQLGEKILVADRNERFSASIGEENESMNRDVDEFDDEEGREMCNETEVAVDSGELPWKRNVKYSEGNAARERSERSNAWLAEKTIPEPELSRLRYAALRMKERMIVGAAGVTEAIVERIHMKWKEAPVVKMRFEGPLSFNMKRAHEILEAKTGGIVIWRSGRSVVLYRGMTYQLPCVQSYAKSASSNSNCDSEDSLSPDTVKSSPCTPNKADVDSDDNIREASTLDDLLGELGPRYKDWYGRSPIPVDADLLPGVVPGYKPPYRLLLYKTRRSLRDGEMTKLRRLARQTHPHFALGRNRQLQGLAAAIVKLWEKSAIAKIVIKRGLPNTSNDRMAEEIRRLTGGTLLSRNKEYIVFYRGKDFLVPSIRDVLVERQQQVTVQQEEEEEARLRAFAAITSSSKALRTSLVAGTLAETTEAKSRWGNPMNSKERAKAMKDMEFGKHTALVRYMERKLALAKGKVRKAEKALAEVQELLVPVELPTDLETVTDEERFLFRNMGLKMKPFLLLGRRDVFDGTVQNMHLHWKHRELVKVITKEKNFAQVKHIAISLEAESGGVLISLDKTTKGYAIIVYRGKNYQRPHAIKPKNLLTKRQALERSIELQRREALKYHIWNLQNRIQKLKSQLDLMRDNADDVDDKCLLQINDALSSEDFDMEEEGDEAYLETYESSDDDEHIEVP